jgi:hypothetical protein
MSNYLTTVTYKDLIYRNPQFQDLTTQKFTFDSLLGLVKSGVVRPENIVVQLRVPDGQEHIRYMHVVNIDDNNIDLASKSGIKKHFSKRNFEVAYVYGVNVFLSKNIGGENLLNNIYSIQKQALSELIILEDRRKTHGSKAEYISSALSFLSFSTALGVGIAYGKREDIGLDSGCRAFCTHRYGKIFRYLTGMGTFFGATSGLLFAHGVGLETVASENVEALKESNENLNKYGGTNESF